MKRRLLEVDENIGRWLSAALEDKICEEFRQDILDWMDSFEYPEINNEKIKSTN